MMANNILDEDNAVIHVRRWGTDIVTPLECNTGELAPGVRLERHDERWWVRAQQPVRVNGIYQHHYPLRPSTEISVGSSRYIAESSRLLVLRDVCRRLHGWDPEQLADADMSLRKICLCLAYNAPIVIRVENDLIAPARLIHRALRGDSAPFVTCSRRGPTKLLRDGSSETISSTLEALQLASGGSLWVTVHDRPKDFHRIAQHASRFDSEVLLLISTANRSWQCDTLADITLPPLRERLGDLPRIIDEYARDALSRRNASSECFGEAQHKRVLDRYSFSLSAIDRTVDRTVALRAAQHPRDIARQLGLSSDEFYEWQRDFAR